MSQAVLVIDLQEKLLPVIKDGESVIRQARKLVQFARLLQLPVLASEQLPLKLGPSVPELRGLDNWPSPLTKSSFSAVPVLPAALPERLAISGVETQVCVRQTVLELLAQGHPVQVIADAVGSRHSLDHDLALAEMRQAGAVITTVEAFAFQLLGSADHPQFRPALALFK